MTIFYTLNKRIRASDLKSRRKLLRVKKLLAADLYLYLKKQRILWEVGIETLHMMNVY